MNYSLMIAAAFILATIAIAALSPFDNLPQAAAPQQTAAAPASSDDGSSDGASYDDGNSSSGYNSGSNMRGHWEPGEAPPQ
jgi:hypothetical protein